MIHRILRFCTLFLVLGIVLGNTVLTASALNDIEGVRYQEAIEFLEQEGIVQGYADGSFRPDQALNRAEMLKILFTAKGQDSEGGENCFTDVRAEWFAPFVCEAKRSLIVKGYADGSFQPGKEVQMVEALKMALETFGKPVMAASEGQQWYQPYADFAHNNNIFSKYSYLPGRSMTRAEMAHLVQALILDERGLQKFSGVRESRSLGCGKMPPSSVPTSSVINGVNQTYITDVPRSYDMNTPIALTFGWHGRTNTNARVRSYYKVYEASQGGTIMVYPAGTGPWNVNRDVVIFDQLLRELSETYCIDMDKVYIVGHSLGAWFTNSLACVRGDVIRASGSLGGGTTFNDCAGPVAAITMHNPADRLSSFSQGIAARDLHTSQNACTGVTTTYDSPEKANCQLYTECAPNNPVVWCPHTEDYSWGDYYPHGWPRWVGQEIWDFFASLE